MLQTTHPKIALRSAPRHARAVSTAAPRAATPAARSESDAAPILLALIVVGALLSAVAMAIVTVVG